MVQGPQSEIATNAHANPYAKPPCGEAEEAFKGRDGEKQHEDNGEALGALIGENAINDRLHREGANKRQQAEDDGEGSGFRKLRRAAGEGAAEPREGEEVIF